jgi:hypothetical protein
MRKRPQISNLKLRISNCTLKCGAVLAVLAMFVVLYACQKRAAVTHQGKARLQDSGAVWKEDLLSYAIDNLNQPERFQTQETFFQIFRQIYSLRGLFAQPAAAAGNAEMQEPDGHPIEVAWPEADILRQIVDRLNQWIRTQPPGDWKADPLLDTLSGPLGKLPLVKDAGVAEFSPFDGYAMQEAVYLRDVALWARGKAVDDLGRAKNLFAWTVSNVQLEQDDKQRVPLFPWESLLFGRGTAMERAWVFILLARQEGLDAVVLALADPAENTPIARAIRPPEPWCAAVLIDDKACLFDPALGMPVPGKDGIRRDPQGRLEIEPATLDELMADRSLLKRLDLGSQATYWVKADDLEYLAALVEASPTELSYRMKLVESHLAGAQKMVLSAPGSAQAQRWKSLSAIKKTGLWLLPYETIERRSRLSSPEIAKHLGEFLRFYALPGAPLAKGRLLHLKGQFAGQDSAVGFYQTARPSYEELGYLAELPSAEQLDRMKQDLDKAKSELAKASKDPAAQPSVSLQQQKQMLDERIADVNLAQMVNRLKKEYTEILMQRSKFDSEEDKRIAQEALPQQALQIMVTNIVQGKQDATYWLALVAYQRDNYSMAEDYLSKRILEKPANSLWRHGAFYNLARSVEGAGQIERAAMIYQSDNEAPDAYGRQLRARWLEEKTDK